MEKPSLTNHLRYRFDNFMAKGGKSIFITITIGFVISFVVIGSIRIIIEDTGVAAFRGDGFLRQIYVTFLQMTDPGNMAQDIGSSSWLKLPAVIAGICGIILLSLLIGFITTALV